jgi:hypothetical protein
MRSHNLRETLVACSSIDTLSASICMAFSDKDVLAARKIGVVVVLLQIASLMIEGVTLGRLSWSDLQCLSQLRHLLIRLSRTITWTFITI